MVPSPVQSAHEHDWSLHPEVCKGADDGCMYKTFNNVAHSVFHIGLNYPNEQGSMWDTKTVTLSVWPYEVVECCAMMCHETTFHGKSHAWNVHLRWNWDTHLKHQSEKGRVVARAHPLTRVICGFMHPHVTSYHARERFQLNRNKESGNTFHTTNLIHSLRLWDFSLLTKSLGNPLGGEKEQPALNK